MVAVVVVMMVVVMLSGLAPSRWGNAGDQQRLGPLAAVEAPDGPPE